MPQQIPDSNLYNPLRMFPSKPSSSSSSSSSSPSSAADSSRNKGDVFQNHRQNWNHWVMDKQRLMNSIHHPMKIEMDNLTVQSSNLYSSTFGEQHQQQPELMSEDYDDFSITSREAESIADEEFCFESISRDPGSFWEQGAWQSGGDITISSGATPELMEAQEKK